MYVSQVCMHAQQLNYSRLCSGVGYISWNGAERNGTKVAEHLRYKSRNYTLASRSWALGPLCTNRLVAATRGWYWIYVSIYNYYPCMYIWAVTQFTLAIWLWLALYWVKTAELIVSDTTNKMQNYWRASYIHMHGYIIIVCLHAGFSRKVSQRWLLFDHDSFVAWV